MNEYVTFHRVLDLIEQFQTQSPILNTFAYGNLVDFGQLHVSGGTVEYPFLFAVPQSIQYDENTTTYQLSLIFADILNYDLSNEKDCVSDMSLEAKRFLSYLKRGIHTFPDLYNNLDINFPVQAIPFFERFGDHVAGVAMDCNLIIFEDLNACDFYPTPTPTPSITPSPTITPTNTETPTPTPTQPCPTQYLKVELQDNTKFKLSLFNDQAYTSPADALCDYTISGVAYGDMGTIYFGTEQILTGQHNKQFDLAPILQLGEIVQGFNVLSYELSGCACPVQVIFQQDIWVAGGTGNAVAYSYEGINWQPSASANVVFSDGAGVRVATNGNLWVAGAVGNAANCLGYSYDGINWNASTNGNDFFDRVYGIGWNGSMWVAGGEGLNTLGYSTDGITWSASTNGNSVIDYRVTTVIWDGGKWLAGGIGINQIAYSTDGLIWSGSTNGNTIFSNIVYEIAYDGILYVAAGDGTNNLGWSVDGLVWSASTNGNSVIANEARTVAFDGTKWVAGGNGINQIAYSTDGQTWSGSTNGNTVFNAIVYDVAWNGYLWIAGGSNTGSAPFVTLAYSVNGLTWSGSTSTVFDLNCNDIASKPAPLLIPPIS